MRLALDDQRILAAFDDGRLGSGLHDTFAVMRALGEDGRNPIRRTAMEESLRRLAKLGELRHVRGFDRISYFMRRRAMTSPFGAAAAQRRAR